MLILKAQIPEKRTHMISVTSGPDLPLNPDTFTYSFGVLF